MGNTFEVHAWTAQPGGGYRYEEVWRGQSLVRCILAARKAKKTCGCVKVEWR